jgi:hypothetical protein
MVSHELLTKLSILNKLLAKRRPYSTSTLPLKFVLQDAWNEQKPADDLMTLKK